MQKIELNLPGMTCETCARKIETAVFKQQGVDNIEFDFKTRNVTVTFDESSLSSQNIKNSIKEAGYEVVG